MVGVGAERTDDSRLQSVVSGQLSATCIALSWMSSSQIQQNWRLRAGTGVTDRRCRRLWTRTRAVRFLLAQSFCNGSTGSGATLPPRTLFRFDELATFFILVNLNIPTQQLQIVCPVGVCQCWYNIVNNVCAKCSIALPCMTATPAPLSPVSLRRRRDDEVGCRGPRGRASSRTGRAVVAVFNFCFEIQRQYQRG